MKTGPNIFKDLRGAALVEFTLLLPFLIVIMAGMLEFGRGLHQYHTAAKGVKNAARYLARVVDEGSCPPSSTAWTTQVAKAKTLAQHGSFSSSDPLSLSNWSNASDITVSVSCVDNSAGTYRGDDDIPVVTVSTSFAYNSLGLLSLTNVPGLTGLQIEVSHEQMFIGG